MNRIALVKGLLSLTEREREVLYYWVQNYKRADIGGTLGTQIDTVKTQLNSISSKFGFSKAEILRDDAGVEIHEIIPNRDALNNWPTIRSQLQNELYELTKGAGSVWIDEDGKAEEVSKDDAIIDGEFKDYEEDDEEEEEEEDEEDVNLLERIRLFLKNALTSISDSDLQSPRFIFTLVGVIVVLVVVIGILLIQRGRQTAPPPESPVEIQVEETLEPVVVVVQITATPLPPPPTPEVTIIEQVVIPDTEVPPLPTEIPTDTLAPTTTFTPTITPTWVEPGDDNLPLKFEGMYDERAYAPRSMILNIDTREGDKVAGTIHFPERGRILGWEGFIVHNFDDITEQAKWYFVEGFGSEGTYIKETRRWEIAGGGNMSGNFYYYISPTGDVTGVRFYFDRVTPDATIELYFSP